MKKLLPFLTLLLLCSFSQKGFSQLKVSIDNIVTRETFPCFNYPNEINFEMQGYDSILFNKSTVSYFDLGTEKMTTVKLSHSVVDINPSGKLSAHYASKKEPITISIKEAFGYKDGEKIKLKKVSKVIAIKLVNTNLLEEEEYARINNSSKLKLLIDEQLVSSNEIILDSTSQLAVAHSNGLIIGRGELKVARLSQTGTARPVFGTIRFTDLADLNKQLKAKFHYLKPGYKYYITFSLFFEENSTLTRRTESLAFLLDTK
jgi:hypothetical protein